MKFDFYSDPGHGWVKVSKELLAKLGISHKISQYSYQRGNFAYLEEDCDANLFVQAMEAHGLPFSFRDHNTNQMSRIRNYCSYITHLS